MKKRIFVIVVAAVMLLALASCSVPTKTCEAGDVSLELPIHYISLDELVNNNATVQEIMSNYVPENVKVNAHIYASPADMTVVAVSNAVINGEKFEQSTYELVEGMCEHMGGDAEIVAMGGTYGIKYTLSSMVNAEDLPEEFPRELLNMTVVTLYYYGYNDCTTVNIACPQEKFEEGVVESIADTIVAD